jgi:hypothetical protein
VRVRVRVLLCETCKLSCKELLHKWHKAAAQQQAAAAAGPAPSRRERAAHCATRNWQLAELAH